MSLSLPDIQRGLLAFYRTGTPVSQTVRVLELREISDGWENEVYSFALADEASSVPVHEDLILRIYPGSDASRRAAREQERLMRNASHIQSVYAVLLERTGIRIPRIEALLDTRS